MQNDVGSEENSTQDYVWRDTSDILCDLAKSQIVYYVGTLNNVQTIWSAIYRK